MRLRILAGNDSMRGRSAVYVLLLIILALMFTPFQMKLAPVFSASEAYYADPSPDSGLGATVKGLTGYVFPGGDIDSSGAILTSLIKADASFNRLFHNGNPTIWGPFDNEINALPIAQPVQGDLLFAVNFEDTLGSTYSFDRMEVWIPPEFQGIKTERVVASFTNNWGNVRPVTRSDVQALTFPNRWTCIRVNSDSGLPGLTTGRFIQFGNASLGDVWAYVRVNSVTAPTIAGRYFFKIGLRVANPIPPGSSTNVNPGEMIWLGSPEKPYQTFLSNGVPNWPTFLVQGEIDPAYVQGTLRYGGHASGVQYGAALSLPGRVRLVGRAIDPYTLQTTNRPVEARGYFNASANGQFKVEGVAPGIYNLYASAAGFPEKLLQSDLKLLKGQSYYTDGYLIPGIVIEGDVLSKCGTGGINWVTWQNDPDDGATKQDIKVEIYKLGQLPASLGSTCEATQDNYDGFSYTLTTQALSWSPVSTPTKLGSPNGVTANWGDIPIGFPWPGYGGKYAKGFDPDGVGPAQRWQVSNTQSSFRFKFGDGALYGAPALLDGHVPQLNATWIDGLPPGSYEIRGFTYGYAQVQPDGETFEHVTFDVPAAEWPGGISIQFDLRLSNYMKKTVHFNELQGSLMAKPIPGKAPDLRHLYLQVQGPGGSLWGWKADEIPAGSTSVTIYSRGVRAQTMSYWGSGSGRNYGFHSGTYTVQTYMYGYVGQAFQPISFGLCGGEIAISDRMYRGAMFNITFQSTDWQRPTVSKPWKYPDEYIYLQIWKDGEQLTGYGLNRLAGHTFWAADGNFYTHDGLTQPVGMVGLIRTSYRIKQGDYVINKLGQSWASKQSSFAILFYEGQEAYKHSDTDVGYYPCSFDSGSYELRALTYGYVMQLDQATKQAKPIQIYATRGGVSDIFIKLAVGTQITLSMRFRHEQIFEQLRYNSTVRVRLFDVNDNLVGEWLTSSSINGTASSFNSAGQVIKGLPSDSLPTTISSLRNVLGPGHSLRATSSLGAQVLETVNYVPRGTEQLGITISGLPDPYASGSGSLYAQNGFDRAFDASPWKPGGYGAPGAPYGIYGAPWQSGDYYVEVEVVPFGRDVGNRHVKITGSGTAVYDGWYPTLSGLLSGESCTIDPRTGTLYKWSIAENRIGPYQQHGYVAMPSAYMSGESGGALELDHLGYWGTVILEFPSTLIVAASSLTAALTLLRRRRKEEERT